MQAGHRNDWMALVEEIWAILHDHKRFDRTRFAALLEQLD